MAQYEFVGIANEEVRGVLDSIFGSVTFIYQRQNVENIAGCRELCIQATNYVCRSATYYTNFQTCKLSEESRRSAPASFRPAARGTFYLENECAVCKFKLIWVCAFN